MELTANHSEIAKNGLKRLWGVPDTTAYVGHLFRMEIPKEAFTGDVQVYKVSFLVKLLLLISMTTPERQILLNFSLCIY